MKPIKKISTGFEKLLDKNMDVQMSAWLGDLTGLVKASNKSEVYVTLANAQVLIVKNQRVPNISRLPVIIGYDRNNPQYLQVLRARNAYNNTPIPDVPEHAEKMHQYPGADTLFVRPEQFLPGLAMAKTGMQIQLYGFPYYLNGWHIVNHQTIDMTASIPTAGAWYTIVEINATRVVSLRNGTQVVSKEVLTYEDIPLLAIDKRALFAVRMYLGQTVIINSDIIDLRWAGASGGGIASVVDWDDVVNKPLVFPPDTSYTDLLYVRKWLKNAPPTSDDDDYAGYNKTDEWLDQANGIVYFCVDDATGAAVWIAVGSGAGGGDDMRFGVEGTLAVAVNIGNAIIITKDMTISEWYIYLKDTGSSSTTIVDVNLNGTTIFTTQANRPEVAYDDADGWAVSGTPDVTEFVAGDVITFDIDQIAPDAAGLSGAGNITGSGGGGSAFNLIVGDVEHVGEIVVGDGLLITDNGGGQVTISAATNYILIRDEKSQGTDGGTFSSGAWRTRDLNTEVIDDGSHASLASNQITLAVGTYRVHAICPAVNVGRHQSRLYDITHSAVLIEGTPEYNPDGKDVPTNHSTIVGQIEITESTTIEVQHQCGATGPSYSFGLSANFGTEIYTIIELWKVN